MAIAQLSVDLIASLAKFDQGMRDAVASSEKASKRIQAQFNQITSLGKTAFIALTGIASLKAFEGVISGAIEAKARLYDFHLQTGMSVSALGALAAVGKYSKTSLDDIAAASLKLNKNLATSTDDGKGAAAAVKALGLNVTEFKALAPEQQLLAVAKAMRQYADDGGQGVAMQLLFGKTGAQLLPFMDDLAKKTELVSKQTLEGALKAKEYEDNLKTLKAAGDEWKKQLVDEILPALVSVTNELIDGRKAFGGYFQAMAGIGLGVDPGKSLAENLVTTREEIGKLETELEKMKARQKAGGLEALLFPSNDAQQSKLQSRLELLRQTDAYLSAQMARQGGRDGNLQELDPNRDGRKPSLKGLFVPDATAARDQENAVRRAAKAYQELITKISEKTYAQQHELETGEKLSEGQQYALDVVKKIADTENALREAGVQLTAQQRERFDGMKRTTTAALENYIALQKLNEAEQEAARRRSEDARAIAQQLQVLGAITEGLRDEREEIGLTYDQIEALRIKRIEEALARRESRLEAMKMFGASAGQVAQEELVLEQLRAQLGLRKDIVGAQRDQRTDPYKGLTAGAQDYLELVKNAGSATRDLVGAGFRTLEGDLTSSLARGKVNIKSFADFALQELYRLLLVRPALAGLSEQLAKLGQGGASGGGLLGKVFGLFGGGSQAAFSQTSLGGSGFGSGLAYGNQDLGVFLADGTNRVPYDGMRAVLHKDEAVVPAKYNPAAGGGAPISVQIVNNAGVRVETQDDGMGGLQILLERAAEQGARRGYGMAVADVATGSGRMSAALKARGVSLDAGLPKRA